MILSSRRRLTCGGEGRRFLQNQFFDLFTKAVKIK